MKKLKVYLQWDNKMTEKIIIDENQFMRTISRISHEIIEKHDSLDNIVIIGIKRHGAELAELIKKRIYDLAGIDLPSLDLDITFYRDDLDYQPEEKFPTYSGASNYINLENKNVILVDDVLFTGRTIRAALDALIDFGRASRVELVIFVDRGHRELPIRADYVGKNIPTSRNEKIKVYTQGIDNNYKVVLLS